MIPWYAVGAAAALWSLYDMFFVNRHVMPALKASFPIIILFFSVIGLALYILSCRPGNIREVSREKDGEEAKRTHHEFVDDPWKKVTGAVIHCVGGDGLGIMSAAVVGHPPKPDTAAFWGFGALGLMAGFLFTYPMNWWMVKIGWKHGMA